MLEFIIRTFLRREFYHFAALNLDPEHLGPGVPDFIEGHLSPWHHVGILEVEGEPVGVLRL